MRWRYYERRLSYAGPRLLPPKVAQPRVPKIGAPKIGEVRQSFARPKPATRASRSAGRIALLFLVPLFSSTPNTAGTRVRISDGHGAPRALFPSWNSKSLLKKHLGCPRGKYETRNQSGFREASEATKADFQQAPRAIFMLVAQVEAVQCRFLEENGVQGPRSGYICMKITLVTASQKRGNVQIRLCRSLTGIPRKRGRLRLQANRCTICA